MQQCICKNFSTDFHNLEIISAFAESRGIRVGDVFP